MSRELIAEGVGTAFLLIGVVGSAVMAWQLSPDNAGVALLANAIATGCVLFVLISVLGPVSGAHFNPAVTLAFRITGGIGTGKAAAYMAVQVVGALAGVMLAHAMFELPLLQWATSQRSGQGLWLAEIIATFGLVATIIGGIRLRLAGLPALVALYITGAYWFTSSTSFANPAVTISRAFTDTAAGISPDHVPAYVGMEFLGAALAAVACARFFRPEM